LLSNGKRTVFNPVCRAGACSRRKIKFALAKEKGKTPLVGGNVPQRIVDVLVRRFFTVYPDGVVCKRKIHPFRALSDDKGVSSPAGDDQGYAPWMGASFLKKA
jgi:hypothetical protein